MPRIRRIKNNKGFFLVMEKYLNLKEKQIKHAAIKYSILLQNKIKIKNKHINESEKMQIPTRDNQLWKRTCPNAFSRKRIILFFVIEVVVVFHRQQRRREIFPQFRFGLDISYENRRRSVLSRLKQGLRCSVGLVAVTDAVSVIMYIIIIEKTERWLRSIRYIVLTIV